MERTAKHHDGFCMFDVGPRPAGRTALGADDGRLKIDVARKQTIRLVKAPPLPGGLAENSDKQRLIWGPDWPVAVKITAAAPAAGAASGEAK